MDASLWVAKTGLNAQQTRMSVISNNLANVNTNGFKRDRAVFEDLLYQNIRQAGGQTGADSVAPTGFMLGTGTRIVATEKMQGQGNMIATENSLDLAIEGPGLFQILQPDGTLAYTRDPVVPPIPSAEPYTVMDEDPVPALLPFRSNQSQLKSDEHNSVMLPFASPVVIATRYDP